MGMEVHIYLNSLCLYGCGAGLKEIVHDRTVFRAVGEYFCFLPLLTGLEQFCNTFHKTELCFQIKCLSVNGLYHDCVPAFSDCCFE